MNCREISRQFLTMSVNLNLNGVKKSVWKFFSVIILSLAVQVSFFVYRKPRNAVRYLVSCYVYFILILCLMKFVFFVAIINQQIRQLLHFLSNFTQQEELVVEYFCFEIVTKRSLDHKNGVGNKIKAARSAYICIEENVNLVKSSNGRTIFLFILLMITLIIWSGYLTFVMMKGDILVRHGNILTLFATFGAVALPISYCQETLNLVSIFNIDDGILM